MAKSKSKAQENPASAPATPATPRGRGAAWDPKAKIAVVTGENARRVVKSLAVEVSMAAIAKHGTVGEYIDNFEKSVMPHLKGKNLPGRGGQKPHIQAAAILRFLEKEGAITVR